MDRSEFNRRVQCVPAQDPRYRHFAAAGPQKRQYRSAAVGRAVDGHNAIVAAAVRVSRKLLLF